MEPETFNGIGMGTGLWVFECKGVVDSQMFIIVYVPMKNIKARKNIQIN